MRSAARLLTSFLLSAAMLASVPAQAQPSEAAVKAAFLPRFARYVTWPPTAMPQGSAPFVLCLVGGDPFGSAIDQAARSEPIEGRRILVRRLSGAEFSGGCHVAFVQGTATQPAGQMLAAMERRPILTVTDARNGGQRGIIHFTIVGGRVRFFIDQAEARRRGLSVSSRLLALAVGVRQG